MPPTATTALVTVGKCAKARATSGWLRRAVAVARRGRSSARRSGRPGSRRSARRRARARSSCRRRPARDSAPVSWTTGVAASWRSAARIAISARAQRQPEHVARAWRSRTAGRRPRRPTLLAQRAAGRPRGCRRRWRGAGRTPRAARPDRSTSIAPGRPISIRTRPLARALVEQPRDLEPAELELVRDVDLGLAVEVVAARDGGRQDQLGRSDDAHRRATPASAHLSTFGAHCGTTVDSLVPATKTAHLTLVACSSMSEGGVTACADDGASRRRWALPVLGLALRGCAGGGVVAPAAAARTASTC